MIHGRPTDGRRPPTSCSRSSSIGAIKSAEFAPPRSIQAAFRPSSGAPSLREPDGACRRSLRSLRADRERGPSRTSRSRRGPRPRSGRPWWGKLTRSAAGIARIATSQRPLTPNASPSPASAPTRLIRSTRRRFGPRARRWWASASLKERRRPARSCLSSSRSSIMAMTAAPTASKAFGATPTTDEVLKGVNLAGKRVLVTGVSAGLGVETARALAAHGAEVVGAARDLSKARAATEQVRSQATRGGSLQLVQLDLASLESVRRCADGLLAASKPFDLIIANAGVMACPKSKTVDGFETQFGTNHLGHFVLVNRIASLLKSGSRLVNLSSAGHRFADVDLEDPNFEHTPYEGFITYYASKP